MRKLALQKNVICDKCEGRGGKKGAVQVCTTCLGSGVTCRVQQLAPGMIQQIQTVCGDCKGARQVFNAKDRCKVCQVINYALYIILFLILHLIYLY